MRVTTKRDDFLQASLQLIHEKGFKATTMRDIAERMDFDVSNSYNYIKSKQDILELFLFRTSQEFHNAMDNILASSYPADEKLKQVISAHIQVAAKKPFEVALMVNEWRNLKEPKYSEYVALRSLYEQKMADLISDGIAKNTLKEMDVSVATAVILSSIRWLYDAYADDKDAMNPVELERQIFGLILNGVAPE
ncbi:TetR/AcrR family transcriptional regulator [Maribacter sp.]|nr:TetR/AcrR family transcriptional regulator [Maribacter sp.]